MIAIASREAELEQLLRHWGRVFGNAALRPPEWEPPDGVDPESLTGEPMGEALRRLRVGPVPASAQPVLAERLRRRRAKGGKELVEVVDLRYTAQGRESRAAWQQRQWHPDRDADRVERAALELYRTVRIRAVVLRVHYHYRWPLSDKARLAGYLLRQAVSKRRYKSELGLARGFVREALWSGSGK